MIFLLERAGYIYELSANPHWCQITEIVLYVVKYLGLKEHHVWKLLSNKFIDR